MGVFEMVVLIVFITAVAGLVRTHLKTRANATLGADHDATLRRLEERVRALESVIADQGYDLKRKIDDLDRP